MLCTQSPLAVQAGASKPCRFVAHLPQIHSWASCGNLRLQAIKRARVLPGIPRLLPKVRLPAPLYRHVTLDPCRRHVCRSTRRVAELEPTALPEAEPAAVAPSQRPRQAAARDLREWQGLARSGTRSVAHFPPPTAHAAGKAVTRTCISPAAASPHLRRHRKRRSAGESSPRSTAARWRRLLDGAGLRGGPTPIGELQPSCETAPHGTGSWETMVR